MNKYDDLIFTGRIEPLPYIIVAGFVFMLGALSFASNYAANRTHQAEHVAITNTMIAEAATHCPQGTRITIYQDGKKTCISEVKRTLRGSK